MELSGEIKMQGITGDNKRRAEKNIYEWQPPEEGWVKLNCDGADNLQLGKAIVGVIARDKKGSVLAGVGRIVHADEPEVTEALAIKTGIKLAKEQGYQKVVIESFSRNVIEKVKGTSGSYYWKT